jgi:hypothetical protein
MMVHWTENIAHNVYDGPLTENIAPNVYDGPLTENIAPNVYDGPLTENIAPSCWAALRTRVLQIDWLYLEVTRPCLSTTPTAG